jgi:transposase-like protein
MARKKRSTYTPEQKKAILAEAVKRKLTAKQVQQSFGVTPVTYYLWRRKLGVAGPRARRAVTAIAARAAIGQGLQSQLRAAVQARVRLMLPDIVRGEVNEYLAEIFGGAPARRGRKPGRTPARRRRAGRPRKKR